MKNQTVPAALLLACLLLPSPAFTQTRSRKSAPKSRTATDSKPDFKETVDWIKEKVLAYANFQQTTGDEREKMFITYKVDSLEFEGCTISLQTTGTTSFSSDRVLSTNVLQTKASLSDLDVSRMVVQKRLDISPPQFYLQIPTLGEQMKISIHSETTKAGTSRVADYTTKQFSLTFTNADIVSKMERAFAAAIKICKDKREPF